MHRLTSCAPARRAPLITTVGTTKRSLLLHLTSVLVLMLLTCSAHAQNAPDLLKDLVDESRRDDAGYEHVKSAHEKLQRGAPNTSEAAIGEAVFIGYLVEAPGKRRFDEINSVFQSLQAKGESHWFTVASRMALLSAYSNEEDRASDERALAEWIESDRRRGAESLLRCLAADVKSCAWPRTISRPGGRRRRMDENPSRKRGSIAALSERQLGRRAWPSRSNGRAAANSRRR